MVRNGSYQKRERAKHRRVAALAGAAAVLEASDQPPEASTTASMKAIYVTPTGEGKAA